MLDEIRERKRECVRINGSCLLGKIGENKWIEILREQISNWKQKKDF